jgi:predicted AAA+ superfamily ATPase
MAAAVLLIGKSGSGKSASLRNFEKEELAVINVENKPFPFKKSFDSIKATDDYAVIKKCLSSTAKKSIVIDDASYLITNQFMRGHSSAGKGNGVFALYNDLGDQFWRLIEHIKSLPDGKIIYVVMHEEQTDFGVIKPKTIGKLLDEKVCVEGLFTIVLRAVFLDGAYVFKTRTDGSDPCKAPMGMFDSEYIPNDLKAVDAFIRAYYGIN